MVTEINMELTVKQFDLILKSFHSNSHFKPHYD